MDSRALEIEKSSASDREECKGVPDICKEAEVSKLFLLCGRQKKLMMIGDSNKIARVGSFRLSLRKFCITRKLKMNIGLVLLQKERR